jgi:hypothetical protein
MASAVAWAESTPAGSGANATDTARTAVTADEQKLAQVSKQRTSIAQHYQEQLGAIDGLKKEKASWRRDRELRQSMADANDTSTQLAKLDRELASANGTLAKARHELVVAIDHELAAGASGTRATQLGKLRAQLDVKAPAKKIVLPDAEIDPLADPEELDQQVQVIAETEKQLANQVAGLDAQAAELAHVADLRKHNERAKDLMLSEDDQPHRNAQQSSSKGVADGLSTPTSGAGAGGGGGTSGGGDTFGTDHGSFETEATFVLGEVIDRSTIDNLSRAQRSGDPAKRADAARAARDAVSSRLDQLKKKRQQIEQRAKQLRKH